MFNKLAGLILDKITANERYKDQSSNKDKELKDKKIEKSLDVNLETFKLIYSVPDNVDVKIRRLKLGKSDKKAAVLFISSIIDAKTIEDTVIKPLLTNGDEPKEIINIINTEVVNTAEKISDILSDINKGHCALFVDGESKVYLIGATNFQGRSIEKPENEVTLKGPKEAFNEKVLTNISLLRKKLRSENLITEVLPISKRSHNDVFILYVKDLVNEDLLKKVKEKLSKLDVDSVQNLSILENYLDERPKSLIPTVLFTERPDRASRFLEDGYIVLLMENSPGSIILPATFWSFYHTADDYYLRFYYGNFTRLIRIISVFITLFTSAIYVSITNYHAEMVPTDLLLAISSTREKVPFPAFVEVLIMELAFELIREAGIRVPGPIGPTIGIVGALILGQAAVQANIVSPIVVIVVALGGLSSFAVGDLNLNFTLRLSRFLFIFAAGFMGIFGMAAVFTTGLFYIVSIKSFGVPYLAPLTPKYISSKDTVFRRMIQNERFRPGYLKPKDIEKQSGDS
ncbi:spore germination protein [Pseudoneobacillus sp. C159]